MKLSQAIRELQALAQAHGDIEIVGYGMTGAQGVSFRARALKKMTSRESNRKIWEPYEPAELRGRDVIMIGGGTVDLLPGDKVGK